MSIITIVIITGMMVLLTVLSKLKYRYTALSLPPRLKAVLPV